MKFQILVCLCIGSALASPASEVTEAPVLKQAVNEPNPVVSDPVPVRQVEQLAPEANPAVETEKESLEPAATFWGGPSFYSAGIGWGGYRGLGYHGYGGYGGYGGYRSYGHGYQPHARYYGGGSLHYW